MRIKISRFAASLLLCCAIGAGTAGATPINVFSTGVDAAGNPLAIGQTDPHFSLISAPAGVPLTAVATAPNPAWTANTSTANWISPGASGNSSWPVGNYDYQTTFDLTGSIAASAFLTINWTSDNNGCIFLNGANTGDCTGFAGFGALTSVTINSGFQPGLNELDFIVNNGGGPTGVIAEISGDSFPIGSPEPASMLLLGAGLLGLAVLLRRRSASKR